MAKKSASPVKPQHTVSDAFAAILTAQYEHLLDWEPKARDWDDTEGVHQVRVALRRMRSALRTFQPAVPKTLTRFWGVELRWLAGRLGPARDLDVFISETLEPATTLPLPGGARLNKLARQHRARAYRQVNAALDGGRYAAFKTDFPLWIDDHGWRQGPLSEVIRQRLQQPVTPFAAARLDALADRMALKSSAIYGDDVEALHQLRIEGKKLRYAADFFLPLFADMHGYRGQLKRLQDLLGTLNDVSVAERIVGQLLDGQRGRKLALFAGGLIGWRSRQFDGVKSELGERWQAFIDTPRPWLES